MGTLGKRIEIMAITREELEKALDELFALIKEVPHRGFWKGGKLNRQRVDVRLPGTKAEMLTFGIWLEYSEKEENQAHFIVKPHFNKLGCTVKRTGTSSYEPFLDTTYSSMQDLIFTVVFTLRKLDIVTDSAIALVDPENKMRGRMLGSKVGITESRKINVESKEEIGEKDVEVSPELIQKAKSMLEHAKPNFSTFENFTSKLSDSSANSSDNTSNHEVSVKNDPITDDQSFEYRGFVAEIKRIPRWQDAWSCAVYKDGNYLMGIKGPQPLQKALETAKTYIEAKIAHPEKS